MSSWTFAHELKHFARAVDIVDDATFDAVRRLVYRYVKTEFQAEYFELTREQPINGDRGLKTFWNSRDDDIATPLWRDGRYVSIVASAYGEDRPMWVVSRNRSALRQGVPLVDQWSGASDLPDYVTVPAGDMRTLVVVPLRRRRVVAAYYLESPAYKAISDRAKEELLLLGDAIAILFEMWDVHKSQTRLTGEALDDLDDVLTSTPYPTLQKPAVFVAYSERADRQVLGVLREVLTGFSDTLEIVDWEQQSEAGNVSVQIVRQIQRSSFGVCYLSEPAPDSSGHRYVDSPNVVFEAGMLHALTDPGSEVRGRAGWLQIREEDSPPSPFDLAQIRRVRVPRLKDGGLDSRSFRELLGTSLTALLSQA